MLFLSVLLVNDLFFIKKILEEKVINNMLMIKNQEAVIQEKTNDLNMLLYRASHDIKGPLKSIDGLSYLGLHDKADKDIYFEKLSSFWTKPENNWVQNQESEHS